MTEITEVIMKSPHPDVRVKETPTEVHRKVTEEISSDFVQLTDERDRSIFVNPREVIQIRPYEEPKPFAV